MITKIINLLPKKLQFYSIMLLLKYVFFISDVKFFIKDLWLKYYLKMLKRTKNYYKTLLSINSNKFVPEDVSLIFIDEVQKKYSDLIHS